MAVAAFAAVFGPGCAKVPEPLVVPVQPSAPEGYVYKGPLAAMHPLWPTARRLRERAAGLEKAARSPALSPKEWLWKVQASEFSRTGAPTPPGAGSWTLEATPTAIPQPAGRADREALRAAREERVRLRYERRQQASAAEEAFKLSQMEIDLWRKAQVALNNLRIQEALGGPNAATAREQQQQIAANIDRQMGEATKASEQRRAQTKADLDTQRDAEIAQIRAEVADRQAAPPPISRATDELKALRSNLDMQWWLPEPPPMELSPETRAMAAGLAAGGEQAVAVEQKQLAETARAQSARLAEAAGRIERLINEDVEVAARSLALAHGVRMHILPLEPATGKDMTAQCADWLKDVWMQH